MENVIEAFIPMIMFIVIGLTYVTWIYFRSKEKQMIIEKGLDSELILALYKKKETPPYALLKTGIILLFFGLGLGIGLLIKVYTGVEEWIPFLIISGLGIGFITAFVVGRKFEEKDKANNLE